MPESSHPGTYTKEPSAEYQAQADCENISFVLAPEFSQLLPLPCTGKATC